MTFAEADWVITHGDSSRSPSFAVCTANGEAVDLEEDWIVRAQARNNPDSLDIIYGWAAGHGIELSSGMVQLSNGRRVTTSTVSLTLLPGDAPQLPRDWSGVVEIEIASDSTTSPQQRYTVARLRTQIVPDITHDVGALIVSPGLPAPSAPAGGVLAGSYPNPLFAVPMATQAQLTEAVSTASAADRQRSNHTGTMSADNLVDGAEKRAYTAAERTKLDGIPADATHNSSDSYLLNRANHTGSMLSTAVSDFAEAVQDTVAGTLQEGTNVSIAYNDATGKILISSAGGGGGGSGGVSGVRTVSGNATAFTGELLLVDCSGGPVTINPPPTPPTGTQITLVRVDPSSNNATWNAPTSGASTVVLNAQWQGATFTYDADHTRWIVTSRNSSVVNYADIQGTVPDSAIPSGIARDQEVADAVSVASAADRARGNHSGTQAISTVFGLQAALDAKEPFLAQVPPKTANYTAAVSEAVPLNTTGGAFTLSLPAGAAVGARVGVRWTAGAALPTISAPPGETIGATQSLTMNLAPAATNGEFIVYQKWSSLTWLPVGGFKPQGALDARYDARYAVVPTLFQGRAVSSQIIAAANTWTPVAFDAEDFDDENCHSLSANTSRFVAAHAGRHRMSTSVLWVAGQSTTSPQRLTKLTRNGSDIPASPVYDSYTASGVTQIIPAMDISLAVGDYVEVQVLSALSNASLFGDATRGSVFRVEFIR